MRTKNFKTNLSLNAVASVVSGSASKARGLVNDNNPNTFAEIKYLDKERIQVHFKKPIMINCVVLKEFIKDGQSVRKFSVEVSSKDKQESFLQSTIGHKRIITFPAREADDIFINFAESKRNIKIAEVETYLIDEALAEPQKIN